MECRVLLLAWQHAWLGLKVGRRSKQFLCVLDLQEVSSPAPNPSHDLEWTQTMCAVVAYSGRHTVIVYPGQHTVVVYSGRRTVVVCFGRGRGHCMLQIA